MTALPAGAVALLVALRLEAGFALLWLLSLQRRRDSAFESSFLDLCAGDLLGVLGLVAFGPLPGLRPLPRSLFLYLELCLVTVAERKFRRWSPVFFCRQSCDEFCIRFHLLCARFCASFQL